MSNATRAAMLSLGAMMLASCAQPMMLERSALRQSVPVSDAIILPPPGGPSLVAVVERRYSNAIQQEITLATNSTVSGSNMFRAEIFGRVPGGGNESLPNPPLSTDRINREMREAFPGVRMQRSAQFVQNAYGPFGYAIGRQGVEDLCIFAWQRITASTQNGPFFATTGTVQTRLRLCERQGSEQSLLAFMYGYTINAGLGDGWNPYGSAPPVDPRLGVAGQEVRPPETFGEPAMQAPVVVERTVTRRPARVAPTVETAPVLPQPIGPAIPLPPSSTTPSTAPETPPVVPPPA